MSPTAELRHAWQEFKHGEPGKRFAQHRHRMKDQSRALIGVMIAIGVLVAAAGVVLLFIPGPGIPLILFGVALAGGTSKRIARTADRLEVRLRDLSHRIRERLRRRRTRRAG
jgi:hypothetical protein